jgi:hypothetical protein
MLSQGPIHETLRLSGCSGCYCSHCQAEAEAAAEPSPQAWQLLSDLDSGMSQ